ncbi:MAG: hypothetical protein NTW62_01320 [Candidatus Nomurabacteria bacterium]|nr:hypothetical protein [Candidatus Nomurabacteria bacterium]
MEESKKQIKQMMIIFVSGFVAVQQEKFEEEFRRKLKELIYIPEAKKTGAYKYVIEVIFNKPVNSDNRFVFMESRCETGFSDPGFLNKDKNQIIIYDFFNEFSVVGKIFFSKGPGVPFVNTEEFIQYVKEKKKKVPEEKTA